MNFLLHAQIIYTNYMCAAGRTRQEEGSQFFSVAEEWKVLLPTTIG